MWDKQYELAESYLNGSEFDNAEKHARKALEIARTNNNAKQIAKSYHTLSLCYMETYNPLAAEILRESVIATEVAYGSTSPELVEELRILSLALEHLCNDSKGAEQILLRAVGMCEKCGNHDYIFDTYDAIVNFYMERKQWSKALPYRWDSLKLHKRWYGESHSGFSFDMEQYIEILQYLGQEVEEEDVLQKLNAEVAKENSEPSEHPKPVAIIKASELVAPSATKTADTSATDPSATSTDEDAPSPAGSQFDFSPTSASVAEQPIDTEAPASVAEQPTHSETPIATAPSLATVPTASAITATIESHVPLASTSTMLS